MVVSKAKLLLVLMKKFILLSMILPAAKATLLGWNGDWPLEISSAFKNSTQSIISGRMVYCFTSAVTSCYDIWILSSHQWI